MPNRISKEHFCLTVILVLINLLFTRYRRGLDQNFDTLRALLQLDGRGLLFMIDLNA